MFCFGIDSSKRLEMLAEPGESPIESILYAVETNPLPVVALAQADAIAGRKKSALHRDFMVA